MKILNEPKELQRLAETIRLQEKRIGFVPTMGALHDGHLSLVKIAKQRADVVMVSVFVNPLQFGKNEDFERYPRPFERDVELARLAGADILFAPSAAALYGEGFQTFVEVREISKGFEGDVRPTHFRGVATVVLKLLNLAKPHVAVFGEKDAQQLALVRRMVADLNLDVEIVGAPIVREPDGLAMSSRNVYLSAEERREATILYRALQEAKRALESGERNPDALKRLVVATISSVPIATLDYAEIVCAEDFSPTPALQSGKTYFLILAARFGKTRLLDNLRFSL
ncbi:MAG: pantoate--beta-alanine ligase [Chloroherpetonaceae bacterium]|nr:pantoate--beta-alanine ligase [Chloroherpetonaceae bacterium]MDW8437769.1 pantoate--beta-alanine ligase [Chloroherpetonaceae bacterium]